MARLLGISRRTLSDWMRKRLIPFERIGPKKGRSTVLFDRDDVDKALKRWRVKSVGD
jgi:excisionase family DNA binding protein